MEVPMSPHKTGVPGLTSRTNPKEHPAHAKFRKKYPTIWHYLDANPGPVGRCVRMCRIPMVYFRRESNKGHRWSCIWFGLNAIPSEAHLFQTYEAWDADYRWHREHKDLEMPQTYRCRFCQSERVTAQVAQNMPGFVSVFCLDCQRHSMASYQEPCHNSCLAEVPADNMEAVTL